MNKLKSEILSYNLSFSEIKDLLKSKKAKISDEFYSYLEFKMKTDVFTVTGLSTIQEIKSVQNSLASSIDSGSTFKDWQNSISDSVLDQFAATLETVYRTNVQTAYNEAAMERALETKDALPYFMYSAINDANVRDEHLEFDGFIAAVDDPVWQIIGPPNPAPDGSGVFNCRCTRIQLTADQAAERGISDALNIDQKKQSLDDYYISQAKDGLSDETKLQALKYLQDLK